MTTKASQTGEPPNVLSGCDMGSLSPPFARVNGLPLPDVNECQGGSKTTAISFASVRPSRLGRPCNLKSTRDTPNSEEDEDVFFEAFRPSLDNTGQKKSQDDTLNSFHRPLAFKDHHRACDIAKRANHFHMGIINTLEVMHDEKQHAPENDEPR
jgi:hypothetical protein